ncbi:MAG: tripartite tricarboxylate transporter substrate binding protein [Proteobacteria bacterium]|nr:tripartite tricarboxylate transporter substrate binding protein [Pseudomonadota bacterium]
MLRIARFAFAMAALLGAAATLAQATAYPNKPVKIIVTFTTGGAADFTARVIGDQLSRIWNQQVVVENRIGAGGSIGVEQVFRSPPDGYTLLLASNTHAINQAMFPNLSFDLVKDFVPVMLTTSTPIVLAVNPRVKANDMKEFTALLRANPGKIDYSTCGVATAHHFAMELYKYATKTYAVHIPHRGCSPAVTDAVAGQVDVVIASLAAVLPFAKQGKLRILGLTTRDRSPSVPDIATFRESGLKELANYEVENYYGVLAPAGTPRDVLAKIEADIRKVLAMPEVKSRLTNGGLDLFVGSPTQFTALLTGDIAKFREAIKVAGIKPE